MTDNPQLREAMGEVKFDRLVEQLQRLRTTGSGRDPRSSTVSGLSTPPQSDIGDQRLDPVSDRDYQGLDPIIPQTPVITPERLGRAAEIAVSVAPTVARGTLPSVHEIPNEIGVEIVARGVGHYVEKVSQPILEARAALRAEAEKDPGPFVRSPRQLKKQKRGGR